MAFDGNKTSNLSALMQTFYDKMMLDYAKQTLVLMPFGQKRDLPQGEGTSIVFTRYSVLPNATTALTEGVNPSGTNLSAENVSAVIATYGDYIPISSLVSLTAFDKKLSEKVPLLSEQMACTLDLLTATALAVNATDQICGTATTQASIAATDILTTTDLKKGVRTMWRNKAMPFKDGYFVLVVGPDTYYDFMNDPLFIDVAKYGDQGKLYNGEIGKWYKTRVIMTTQPFRGSVNADTYSATGACHSNLLLARNSFGVTKLTGAEKKLIVKVPGPGDTSNPLDRFSTAGWLTKFVPKVLNADWLINIKTGATA